jgi:ferrous iron transport protein B
MAREDVVRARDKSVSHLRHIFHGEVEAAIAGERYGFIGGLLKDVLKRPATEKVTISDKIDRVLVHRVWGIPIFFGIIFGVFRFVFDAAGPLKALIDTGFANLAGLAAGVSPIWWGSLLGDGIISGIGSVLSFVPNIFFLFIAIAILEDCGYMSRAAFVMDRAMHRIGLHGRSFIPLMLGFGCTIPAIMACRTIENRGDRLTTMLATPFISCGARLPIYVLIGGAFFTARAGVVVFAMYLIGIGVAVFTAWLLRNRLFRGESGHFVMELPPYRVPWGVGYASEASALGRMGSAVAPVFSPLGFGQWQAAASLVFGFLAKEIVVGSMGAIFAVSGGSIGGALMTQLGWTPLIAFSFMAFSLLYIPCVASIGTIRSEAGAKWAGFAVAYTFGMAWIVALIIYQIGRFAIGG